MSDIVAFDYDVAICGTGPAGAIAALELTKYTGLKVLVLEKMKRLHDSREVANGFMGGSSRSDVKMFLTPGFGGDISNKHVVPDLLEIFEEFSRHSTRISHAALSKKQLEWIKSKGAEVDEPEVATMSSEVLSAMEKAMYLHLLKKVDFKSNCSLDSISKTNSGWRLLTSAGTFAAKNVILSLGRGGANWLTQSCEGFSLECDNERFDLGIRLEFPHTALREYTDKSTNFRIRFGDYRTTSISDRGTVELENVYDIKTSNGRTMGGKSTGYSNMALIKTIKDPNALARMMNLVQIVNILADGQLLREPLARLFTGGSQLCHLPEFLGLREGIEQLLEVFPALRSRCFLYAPEARLNALRIRTSDHFETKERGLYVCGDMSGRTKSFIQAACSGLLAARNIICKEDSVVEYGTAPTL